MWFVVGIFSPASWAQVDYYWLGAPGVQDWGTAANWNPNAVPGAGDTAYLEPNDANDRVASFRNIHPAGTTLNVISVNALGAGNMTLELGVAAPAGDLRANTLYLGATTGRGLMNQSNGTVNIGDYLYLGAQAGSQGAYEITAGDLTANNLVVGEFGAGAFSQSENTATPTTVTVTNDLGLGTNAGSQGAYNLQGGSLLTNYTFVGHSGEGEFTHSGGWHIITNELLVGHANGGQGAYNLSDTGMLVTNNTIVGNDGGSAGAFNQSGGGHLVAGTLTLGMSADSQGTYNLSGDGVLNTGADLFVGDGGTGNFSQTGGTVTITDHLGVGREAGSTGSYLLQGGSFSTTDLYVGHAGQGEFIQQGGTLTITDNIYLANENTGQARMELQGGTLVFGHPTTANIDVGADGIAEFIQHTGVNLVLNTIFVSSQAGTSTFTQRGDITLNDHLGVGRNVGSRGAYTLWSGTLNTGQLFLGFNGTGAFTQQGGTVNIANDIRMGDAGTGTYNLVAGNLLTTDTLVGIGGTGSIFNQSGGSHGITNLLSIAVNPGSSGTYNLSGGTLTAPAVTVGTGGIFNLLGGQVTTGDLQNQGLVRGFGPLFGHLTNNGQVNPGNSAGTLTVVGSYTQSAAGTYMVEIASATNYDRINVSGAPGNATLGGTLAPVLLGGYKPAKNQVFSNIITATGGVTGTFANIVSPFPWNVLYHTNSVDLVSLFSVYRNFTDPALHLTGNQQNVGRMLNALADTASGDLAEVLATLSELPDSQVGQALQQLSPDKGSALPTLSFASSLMQGRSLINRMNFLRRPGGGALAGGSLSGRLGMSYSRLSGLMLAYNGASLGSLFRGRPQTDGRLPWGLFTNFVGVLGTQDTTANQTGYSYHTFGFNSGLDYRFRDDLVLGVGSGYYHTAAYFKSSGGDAEMNSIPFYAYGVYHPGAFYLMGSLGYTVNIYELARRLAFGTVNRRAKSSFTGSQFNLNAETGYDFTMKRLIVTPAVNLNYSKAWVPGYTEYGADSLNLRVAAQDADSVQTGVGARLTLPFKAGDAQVIPEVSAFYQHEFSNHSRGLDARLNQAGSTFTFKTDAPARDFAVLGAGVNVGVKKNLFLQANYNAEVGRRRSTAHYLNAGLRWEF